jgi:diacylglycerol kinase (ATP)
MSWQIIVNPHAGRRGSPLATVERGVQDRDLVANIHESASLDDLMSTVAAAARRGERDFVAVGGDGTAHHILNAALGAVPDARLRLSIIPAGSGSDFVRTFALPTDIAGGLDRLVEPTTYAIDIGVVTLPDGDRYFLNAVNSGVAAQSVSVAERLPRWIGSIRYTAAFWMALGRFHQAPAEVDIDHHRFRGDAINIVVANGQFFGGGLNIAPRATLVDGVFDVQVFSGPRRNAFTVMPRVLFGSHLTHRAVRRYVGSEVGIDVPEDWPLEADGELLGRGPASVRAVPQAVDFVI